MPLAPGTQLGPYEIRASLGSGGMGEVYRATDTRLRRDVAVKVLSSRLITESSAKQRFEREARTFLQDRLSRIPADGFARGVTQANQFMPAGKFGMVAVVASSARIDRRVNRDVDTGRPRQVSAIAQKSSSPGK